MDQSVVTHSLKRKLHPAQLPAGKRLHNLPVENRSAPGMRLRPRSRSVSPKECAPKKKDSPPPSVIRPDAAVDAQASEGIILRPRQKSPIEKKLSPSRPRSSLTEKKRKSPTEEEKKKKSPTEEKKGKKKPPAEEVKRKVFPPVAVLARKPPNIEKFQGFEHRLARMLPRIGFTQTEYEICTDYMWRLDFEYLDPTPKKYEPLQVYVDQIRNTKGYGVTVESPPYFNLREFEPLRDQWKRNRRVRKYVAKMIGMVLDDIKVKLPRESYEAAGEEIENLVESGFNHLLSFQVHRGTPTDPPRIVEALFFAPPGPLLENLMLLEWKMREGSEVVFCTVPTYKTNF